MNTKYFYSLLFELFADSNNHFVNIEIAKNNVNLHAYLSINDEISQMEMLCF